MPESPSGYFPDYRIRPVPEYASVNATEIETAWSGEEQRRIRGNERKYLAYETVPLYFADRKVVYDFLKSKSGEFAAFYLFNPVPEDVAQYNIGSVSGVTQIIAPWKGVWWVQPSASLHSVGTNETPVSAVVTALTVNDTPATGITSTPNIGSGGEDRISWTGPDTGVVLATAQLVRLRLVVRNNAGTLREVFDELSPTAEASFPVSLITLI